MWRGKQGDDSPGNATSGAAEEAEAELGSGSGPVLGPHGPLLEEGDPLVPICMLKGSHTLLEVAFGVRAYANAQALARPFWLQTSISCKFLMTEALIPGLHEGRQCSLLH